MADQGQRTEKPTKRKLEKSRREGQFPASRELLAALQFLTFVVLLVTAGGAFFERTAREWSGYFLAAAFHLAVTPRGVLRMYRRFARAGIPAVALDGGCAHCRGARGAARAAPASGLSLHNLAPDPKRLNPSQKLRNVPGQNAASFLQALLFLPLLAIGGLQNGGRNLAAYAGLARRGSGAGLAHGRRFVSRLSVEGGGAVLR